MKVKISDVVQKDETSFFRDFVDNSDLRIGNALLTNEGRSAFRVIKVWAKIWVNKRLSMNDREGKLLEMGMLQHAVSQVLSEIAMEEDNK